MQAKQWCWQSSTCWESMFCVTESFSCSFGCRFAATWHHAPGGARLTTTAAKVDWDAQKATSAARSVVQLRRLLGYLPECQGVFVLSPFWGPRDTSAFWRAGPKASTLRLICRDKAAVVAADGQSRCRCTVSQSRPDCVMLHRMRGCAPLDIYMYVCWLFVCSGGFSTKKELHAALQYSQEATICLCRTTHTCLASSASFFACGFFWWA